MPALQIMPWRLSFNSPNNNLRNKSTREKSEKGQGLYMSYMNVSELLVSKGTWLCNSRQRSQQSHSKTHSRKVYSHADSVPLGMDLTLRKH